MSNKIHMTQNTQRTFRTKVFTMVLLILELFTNTAVPLSYARSADPNLSTQNQQENAMLLTETKPSPLLPFSGELSGNLAAIPSLRNTSVSNLSARVRTAAKVRKLLKGSYRPNEEIALVIDNGADYTYKTELIGIEGDSVALETEEVVTDNTRTIKVYQPSSFRPGKYRLRITDTSGNTSEQDFTWGVLAINPDKSVYTPGDTSNLAIAVLDETGDMVCDAKVELRIKKQESSKKASSLSNGEGETLLSTENGKIIVNPECTSHDFTLKPDYEAQYKVGDTGIYTMELKAMTRNGEYTITDSFEVRKSVPFDVKRVTATRIYPPNTYPVTLEVTANQDFTGIVTETVPDSFQVSRPGEDIIPSEQFDPSRTASESAGKAPADVQAPESAPVSAQENNIISAYNTINSVINSVQAVLGASVPGLGMPFGVDYPITQGFGESKVFLSDEGSLYTKFGLAGHDGIDFGLPMGTPILAAEAGTVVQAGKGDYGLTVIIQHAWGKTYYGHFSKIEVKEGQEVLRGSQLGLSGSTGWSTGPHLHFGIKPGQSEKENGFYGKVDPAYYLGLKQPEGQVLGVSAQVAGKANTRTEISSPVSTDVRIMNWKISVKKGDKIKLGYNYLAPRVSPQFYTLGPATFAAHDGKTVFHEERKWQIAADAMDLKFEHYKFTKSACTAPCTQSITGVGFRPKAVIFEWTVQSSEGYAANQQTGMGFATADSSAMQNAAVSYWSQDNVASSDTGRRRSDAYAIIMQSNTGSVLVQATVDSMDGDGFTLRYTNNDSNAYIIRYTAIGGADVSRAKVGTFDFASGAGSQSITDPGFRPDFVMVLGAYTEAVGTSTANAVMNVGFASGPSDQGGFVMQARDAQATTITRSQQRTDNFILLLNPAATATQVGLASLTSFDATGFTINKTTASVTVPQFYLAIQGGQYDVGAITQPTSNGSQTTTTGFKPSGAMFLSKNKAASTSIENTASLTVGGASSTAVEDSQGQTDWCNDNTGVTCDTAWLYRKKITFDTTDFSSNQSNFPLMVKLNNTRIDYSKTQNSGQDIRFVDPADNTVVLPHEIESWNESGDSFVWVNVPQLDGNSPTDSIWMYYGNSGASDGQAATSVWDGDFESVWHLKENPGGTVPQMQDSTSNNRDGTSAGTMTSGNMTTGQINGALNFDGDDDQINISNYSQYLASDDTITIEGWVYPRNLPNTHDGLFGIRNNTTSDFYILQLINTNNLECRFRNSSGLAYTAHNDVTPSTWSHFALVYDGSAVTCYVNGVAGSPVAASGTFTATTTAFNIGSTLTTNAPDSLDEVRVSTFNRSVDWLEATYLSGSDQINTFGTEEPYSAGTQGAVYREGSIWSDDITGQTTNHNANMSTISNKAIRMALSPVGGGAAATTAEASIQLFDQTGFTLNWTDTDATARQVLYWAAGSVYATEEDYRWYINTNSITPVNTMNYENRPAILTTNKPYARLRTNVSAGGNSINSSSQSYKLQYSTSTAAGVDDWCNDTSGVTCTPPTGAQVPDYSDWCNDTSGVTCTASWTSRRKIIFDNSASATNLANFPVLVKLDNSRIDYSKTQNSGQDIRFVDASNPNVALDHEIESWNEAGTSYVWVRVPQIDANSDTDYIWMYYGNNSIADGQAGTSVWDTDHRIVYHMKESGASIADSTTNGKTGTKLSATEPAAYSSGQINGAEDFDGSNDRIQVASPNLPTGNFTYSAWIKSDSSANYKTIFQGPMSTGDDEIYIARNSSGQITVKTNATHDAGPNLTGNTVINNGNWGLVTVTRSGSTVSLYVNGVSDGSYSDGVAFSFGTCPLFIGMSVDNSCSPGANMYFMDGLIDEARISNIGRTADWIRAEYLTGNDQMNFFDTEQTYGQSDLGWAYRRKITFDNSASASNLTSFPLMVKLDNTNMDYSKTQNSGQDIRFVDPTDNTTVLAHEIEKWDETGTSIVWVEVPQIDAGSTTDYIWMYYGNSGAPDGQQVTSVWSNGYEAVYHLNNTPTGSAGDIVDSTGNHNARSYGSMSSGNIVVGPVGPALNFNGTSNYIQIGDIASTHASAHLTLSAWTKKASSTSTTEIGKQKVTSCSDGILLESMAGTDEYHASATGGTSHGNIANNSTSWQYRTLVYDGTQSTNATRLKGYLNGAQLTFSWTGTIPATLTTDTANFYIGKIDCAASLSSGAHDEVRFSNATRTADWVNAEFLNMNDQMNTISNEMPWYSDGVWTDVGDPWCNDAAGVTCTTDWAYRRKITFDSAAGGGSSPLTNFPVLVKLNNTRINYAQTQNSGQDIRFVDPSDPTTVLPHEIESWNEAGDSYVWVKVQQYDMSIDGDYIWMYYGNGSIADGQAGTSVWDTDHRMVYHMKESGATIADSTTNGKTGTKLSATEPAAYSSGQINGAEDFDGSNDRIETAASPGLPTGDFTYEAWINSDVFDADRVIYMASNGSGGNEFYFGVSAGKLEVLIDGVNIIAGTTTTLTTGAWYHAVVTRSGSSVKIYINGSVDPTTGSNATALIFGACQLLIGTDNDTSGCNASLGNFWNGKMDELRVSNIARSPDWIRASYLSESDQMNTFGTEETQSTAVWKFKDNSAVTNGTTITSSLLSSSTAGNQETYQESNYITLPTTIAAGETREWDFSLDGSRVTRNVTYYFRIVTYNGTPFTGYTNYPTIICSPPLNLLMRHGKFFSGGKHQPFTF